MTVVKILFQNRKKKWFETIAIFHLIKILSMMWFLLSLDLYNVLLTKGKIISICEFISLYKNGIQKLKPLINKV